MECPRDGAELKIEHHQGIEVDHCPTCNGRWLDHHELDLLESTVAPHEDQRRATIEFAKRPTTIGLWGMVATVIGVGLAIAGLTFMIADYVSRQPT